MVLDRSISVRCHDSEDRNQEKEHGDCSAPYGGVAHCRQDSNGRLAPGCAEEVFDEEASHGDPELVVAQEYHTAAGNGNHCSVNANIGLCHVVEVVIAVADHGGSESTDEAADQAGDLAEHVVLVHFVGVYIKVIISEQAQGNTLHRSKTRGYKEPIRSVIDEELPQGEQVVGDNSHF